MFWAAKCVKLLRSKVCILSKVFFEAKCALAPENFLLSYRCLDLFDLQFTLSVLIRNGPIRHTSEIFGFFKK